MTRCPDLSSSIYIKYEHYWPNDLNYIIFWKEYKILPRKRAYAAIDCVMVDVLASNGLVQNE